MTSTYPKEIQTSQLTEMFNGINNLSSLDLNRFILTHKKHETQKKNYKSNLCFKINEQNIKKTKFGININIPSKLLKDYLQNGQIINASLDFSLSNLSKEKNFLFLQNEKNEKELIAYFSTQDSNFNSIFLSNIIKQLQYKISKNQNICFFIPIFATYDNYDDFYEAISNVSLKIKFLE